MPEQSVNPADSFGAEEQMATQPAAPPRGSVVPVWLLAVVMALFVAVLGLGAYAMIRTAKMQAESSAIVTEIDRLEAIVVKDPSDVNARVNLAYAHQQDGRFTDAIAEYDFALRTDEDNVGALYNKALCLLELKRGPEAATTLVRVLEIAPQHSYAAKALGEYYLETNQAEKIPGVLAPAVTANPSMADLHALLGAGYEQMGQAPDALREYRAALRLSPQLETAKAGVKRLEGVQ